MKLTRVDVRKNLALNVYDVDIYFGTDYMWGFRLDAGMTRQEVADRLLRAGNLEMKKLADITEGVSL